MMFSWLGSKKEVPTEPAPCDPEIFAKGVQIGIITGANSWTIDAFIKCVAKATGVKMDWHYVGGRARVLVLGESFSDIEVARKGLHDYALHVTLTEIEK